MELICEKFKERMPATAAGCRHPNDYCKFRPSCMIRFLAGDKEGADEGPQQQREEQDQSGKTAD